ncbi:MAG: replication-associated recombination protein A [Patescibacteria group bacterium]
MDNLFSNTIQHPLAERLRPEKLSDFVGQEHILGKDKLLRRIIESDRIFPMIFWGPPGCGKTTLAKIIAEKTKSNFVFFSAVTGGVGDARKIIEQARNNLELYQKLTILFVDEIHRFNKSQQDAFLPHVENGTIVLLGATTENPSFEINAPLLSRARVFHFRELGVNDVVKLINQAIKKINKDPSKYFPKIFKEKIIKISITAKSAKRIAELSEGDARDAYNALELAIISAKVVKNEIVIDEKLAEESIQQKFIRYDKGADGHYDAISALHKSLRASDVDAGLHYMARMLEAGEDPLYIIRRLVRFAAEDIGMADPQALILATSAQQAVHFVGMPESNVIVAELVIYLAKAPKSRAVDDAYAAAKDDVVNKRLEPIPLDIRNAPTKMMRDFGFGKGYEMYSNKSHLPENLKNKKYWKE